MRKSIIYFFIGFGVLFLFFYFYPAQIFPAEIKNDVISLKADVSLKSIIHQTDLPAGIIQTEFTSVHLTLQGYILLIVCLIGLPLMIALRFGGNLKKQDSEKAETK